MIDRAIKDEISNIKLLTALKTMPAVVDRLCGNGADIDGFIAPGHVCAVTGAEAFLPLAEKYNIPFAVSRRRFCRQYMRLSKRLTKARD